MKDESKLFFETAQRNLNDANTELMRPEEDVVPMLVCKNAQLAIENNLKGYLNKNGVDTEGIDNIDKLFEECISINPNFKKLDIEGFSCTYLESGTRYCEQVSKVSNCYKVADSLDNFLRDEHVIA